MEGAQPQVLVAPLDWGLGHSTRCIPIIRELQNEGARVFLAAAGTGKNVLESVFPECSFVDIPGIRIQYSNNLPMAVSMLLQLPSILSAIRKEHLKLLEIASQLKLTHVISDNRYGLYHPELKTAFITHQVHIRANGALQLLEPLLYRMNKSKIEKYNQLWIPDFPSPDNLSGLLSENNGVDIPVHHLGLLSRFSEKANPEKKTYDYIALLSGPEPQRTLLEKKILKFFAECGKKCLLVQGIKSKNAIVQNGNIKITNLISDNDLLAALHKDTILICRPGYSTIMDLAQLDHRKVIFIPTPGQTEQEYLSQEMQSRFGYTSISQNKEIPAVDIIPGEQLCKEIRSDVLKKTIGDFLYR